MWAVSPNRAVLEGAGVSRIDIKSNIIVNIWAFLMDCITGPHAPIMCAA